MSVQPGELVCVVGPSGCGKSTILNAIAGLRLPGPLEGEVRLGGEDRTPYDRRIAYMVQQDTLLPWRTTLRNVELVGKFRNKPVDAQSLLEQVGLGQFGHFYPQQLSGGMRKRAQLARVLAQSPELLLMDEPFGALDFQTRAEIHTVFLDRWAELRCGVVFVTHDLAEAITLADRIVVMGPRPAHIVAEFDNDIPRPRRTRELVDSPEYRTLYHELWAALSMEG